MIRDRRLTIALVVGVVVIVAAGGGAALAVSRHQHLESATSAILGSTAPPENSGGSVEPTTSTQAHVSGEVSASAAHPAPAQPAPAQSAPAQSGQPGTSAPASSSYGDGSPATGDPTVAPTGPSNNLTVQMAPSVRSNSRALDVQQLLQGFFDAINQHNYASWKQLVTNGMSTRQSSAQWLQAYATTVDSSIWMQSIRDNPFEVQLRFTSQQDPELAPKDLPVACINWGLTYQLVMQDGQLVVGPTVAGSVTMTKCP